MAVLKTGTFTIRSVSFTYTISTTGTSVNNGDTADIPNTAVVGGTGYTSVNVKVVAKVPSDTSNRIVYLATSIMGYGVSSYNKTLKPGASATIVNVTKKIRSNFKGETSGFNVSFDYRVTRPDGEYSSGTKTYNPTIPTIDRTTVFNSVTPSSANVGGTFTVGVTKKSTTATSQIQYLISTGGSSSSWKSVTVNTLSFSIPAAEIPNAKTSTIRIRVVAVEPGAGTINTTAEKTVTLNVPEAAYKPEVSNASISDAGMWSENQSYLERFGVWLTSLSRPYISWTESYKGGAGPKSRAITVQRSTYTPTAANFTTPALTEAANQLDVTGLAVTDSRTYTSDPASATDTHEVVAYAKPSINNTAIYRCDSSGNRDDANGTYVKYDLDFTKTSIPDANDAEQNFVAFNLYTNNGTTPVATWDEATDPASAKSAIISGLSLPTTDSVTIRVEAVDTVGVASDVLLVYVAPAIRVMSFREDGTGLAIGKVSNQAGFECEWDAQFNGAFTLKIDTTAVPGTTDGDLYAAITALGWESEVIE